MVKTLGLNNKSDIIGKTDYELPWAAQAHTLIKNDNEVMKEDKIQQNKEELVQTPDGVVHTFMVTKSPFRDEHGEIAGTLGCSIDITDRIKMEEELKITKKRRKLPTKQNQSFYAIWSIN